MKNFQEKYKILYDLYLGIYKILMKEAPCSHIKLEEIEELFKETYEKINNLLGIKPGEADLEGKFYHKIELEGEIKNETGDYEAPEIRKGGDNMTETAKVEATKPPSKKVFKYEHDKDIEVLRRMATAKQVDVDGIAWANGKWTMFFHYWE